MRPQVELGLEDDPPAPGPPPAPVEGPPYIDSEDRGRAGVRGGRPRRDDQLPADDLADEVLRQRHEVVVRGFMPGCRYG